MKSLVDVHVVLATPADLENWDEDAEEAAERLNTILHLAYDLADEDIDTSRLEKILHHIWVNWHEDSYLLEIDDADLHDWVDQLLATWDDAEHDEDYEQNY
ncbi:MULTISPECIES: hypothetical protein [Alteromonadaceae]|uniref:hypothetical protein n=1 Tax=Alteromonadaceae TaxID=72275 RepID=UPI001C099F56|nr:MULTISPECIES: hypothetical protein [Aliiglaciecola]MBU2876294.1 hypothetical protein [Aliiglaciecola lipolytica]MDO6710510.1 hypothetical protein [Aliiglaciecola sp. 2_MG-2023]MDO6751625.1 hypothetical protein [Aliiglaciecola sp. 1_MG-2023]